MSDAFESTHLAEIASFVGKRIIYSYENSGLYEVYLRNDRALDYRVHGGPFAGGWFKGQAAHIVRLADGVAKVSWTEESGACVSVAYNLVEHRAHGVTFLPDWLAGDPKKIAGHQNEKLDEMQKYRDAGPTYPIHVVDEFATITFVEDCGRDDESVIACGPEGLPAGYATRRNVG